MGAGMAPELVAKIHADLAAALKDPVVLTALDKMGATPVGSSPKDFDALCALRAGLRRSPRIGRRVDVPEIGAPVQHDRQH